MFSTDFLLMTLVNGFSTMAASLLLEYTELQLYDAVKLFAVLQILSGVVWVMLITPGEKGYAREQALEKPKDNTVGTISSER